MTETSDNSSPNIPRLPPHQQAAADWWGSVGTKVVGAVLVAVVLGLGGWMTTIYGQLITLNLRIEQLAKAIEETKEIEATARANDKRLSHIESTRFTDDDAAKLIAPIEHRLQRLESGKR